MKLPAKLKLARYTMQKLSVLKKYGAFVELFPGKDALLHISQISKDRINKVEDVLKIGDTIEVKITEIDKQGRKMRLIKF